MATKTVGVPYRILRDDTQAILIDVQEKLTPHIHDHEAVTDKMAILIQGLQALGVPVMLNEQYKKGLGETIPKLYDILDDANKQSFEKLSFSVCDNAPSWAHIVRQNRRIALLFGIETHVCVLQTALDLLDNGMQPVIVADAVGSRNPYDKKIALRRMRRAGAVITTTEAILFELLRGADDPAFKTIAKLVK
ncbi:isochorismatase family protein [Moraxella pluranimalium]|uniref:Hydrolase n=1 Tax=Moraxella pluranimalium TaxID=470453 RepID=A0A1T0CQE1_9GAMM|nr:isochorismatase family protein [Moraxella pluranimalium]OOS24557.1 hydrolase [Moraxella pluranimalium]